LGKISKKRIDLEDFNIPENWVDIGYLLEDAGYSKESISKNCSASLHLYVNEIGELVFLLGEKKVMDDNTEIVADAKMVSFEDIKADMGNCAEIIADALGDRMHHTDGGLLFVD
jgi:hypothetical protein